MNLTTKQAKPTEQRRIEAMNKTTERTRARGRPSTMQQGKRVLVYLDEPSVIAARRLGGGNVSAGIRRALAEAERTGGKSAR